MAQIAKSLVLGTFEAGDRPTDVDFQNLFDSVLFLNNVGSHSNGLNSNNTSIEGNFTVGGNLSIDGTGILYLSGSVSIGNPNETVSSRLHVYNSDTNSIIYASGSTSNTILEGISGDATSSILLRDSGGSTIFGTHTGKFFAGSDKEYFHISASSTGPVSFFSGSVGIGITSPSQKLHVKGSDHTAIQVDSSGGTDKNAFIKLTNDAQSFSLKTIGSNDHLYIVNESSGTSPFKITTDAPSNNLVLRNGRVGILTDNPAQQLHVSGGTSDTRTLVETTTGNAIFRVKTSNSDFSVIGQGGSNQFDIFNTNQSKTPFKIIGGADDDNTLVIKSNKVAIGHDNPSELLHISSSTDDVRLKIQTGKTDGIAQVRFQNDAREYTAGITTDDKFVVFDATASTVPFKIEPATPSSTLVVDSNGRVGIGTDSPAQKLDINGGHIQLDSGYGIGRLVGDATDESIIYPYLSGMPTSFSNITAQGTIGSAGLSLQADQTINFIETDNNTLVGHMNVNEKIFDWDGKINAQFLYGDGSNLTNVSATAITALIANDVDNRIITAEGDSTLNAEANFEFTGNDLRLSGSFAIGQGTAGLFTPDAPLHIFHQGDSLGSQDLIHLSMTSTTTEGDISIKFSDAGNVSTQHFKLTFGEGSNDLKFHSDSDDNILYLEHDGNVGIGTNDPESKLGVLGDIAVRNAADNANVILFQNDNSITTKADILFNENGALGAMAGLHMFLNTDGGTDKFAIYTGGEGTDNTSEIFTVQSGSFGTGLRLTSNNDLPSQIAFGGATFTDPTNGDAARIKLSTKNTGGSNYEGATVDFLVFEKTDSNDTNPDGGILFTNTGNDNTEEVAMAIRGDGKIGLQELSPSARLHIKNDNSEQSIFVESDGKVDAVRLHRTDSNGVNINFTNTTDTNGYFVGMSSGEMFAVGRNSDLGTDPILTISSSHITMFGKNSNAAADGGIVFKSEHNATGPSVPNGPFNGDSDVTTHQIIFSAADGSSDPGLIAHQTRGTTDTNTGIIHLCPSDDSTSMDTDFVFIHGRDETLGLRLGTSGQIQMTKGVSVSGTGTSNTLLLGTTDGTNIDNLAIQSENGTTSIGMENTSYTHYKTEATLGHYFQQGIVVDNNLSSGTLNGKAGIESYDTDLFLFDHDGKSYIQIKENTIDMYANSIQVLDIADGSDGVSISGDGTHTRSNPLGIADGNISTRLQIKGTHGGSTVDADLSLLDVMGTSQGDALIHFGQTYAAGGFIYYRGDANTDSAFDNFGTSDTIYFGGNAHLSTGNVPVISYRYNAQHTNFHGDVGIGLSSDGSHEVPDYRLQVKAASSNEIAEFRSDNEDAYIRISQQHDVTGAAGVLYVNTSGNRVFSGYHDARAKFVYATGPSSTNGIIIDENGQVGINENDPIGQLHLANKVSSLIIDQGGAVTSNSATGSNHAGRYADAPAIVIKSNTEGSFQAESEEAAEFVGGGGIRFLDNDSTKFYEICNIDDRLVFGHSNGGSSDVFTLKGFIDTTFVEEIQFTGQHMSRPVGGTTSPFENKVGYIVISNGSYNNINHDDEPTINEAIPLVSLSTQINDKRVFGVISSYEDDNGGIRTGGYGGFKAASDYSSDDSRLVINSLGEGAIMVSNYNGNLENGDYITTSPLEGLGMKQDDDLLHNYTVAKITQDEDFSEGTSDIGGYKFKLVGCTYHCG